LRVIINSRSFHNFHKNFSQLTQKLTVTLETYCNFQETYRENGHAEHDDIDDGGEGGTDV